jgi:hypothetical protein
MLRPHPTEKDDNTMAATPQTIELALDSPEMQDALRQAAEGGYAVGHEKGFIDALNFPLDWIQAQYIDSADKPDRDSVEAKALLELARRLAKYMNKKRSQSIISQEHAAADLAKFLESTKKPAKKAPAKKTAAKKTAAKA